MQKGLTEIVFLLDESGSMIRLRDDTINGYNRFLEQQKELSENVLITTISFNDTTKMLQRRTNVSKSNPITKQQYSPSGSTALLDALGEALYRTRFAQQDDGEKAPEKTIFVIITDGYDNSSQEYEYEVVGKIIRHSREARGWQFLFLGTSKDIENEIARLGIMPEMFAKYLFDSNGIRLIFEAIKIVVSHFTQQGKIPKNWKKKIEEHLENSKKD